MAVRLIYYLYLIKSILNVHRGVQMERAHYYTILVDGVRTIREGVLIEDRALTEVIRYLNRLRTVLLKLNVNFPR